MAQDIFTDFAGMIKSLSPRVLYVTDELIHYPNLPELKRYRGFKQIYSSDVGVNDIDIGSKPNLSRDFKYTSSIYSKDEGLEFYSGFFELKFPRGIKNNRFLFISNVLNMHNGLKTRWLEGLQVEDFLDNYLNAWSNAKEYRVKK